ncbi:MAG: M1 family metallopeptidase [Thermoplasmata archaeon]|nr:M1 family metallopeptidase [Thermoplasmata archaeon]
MPVDSYDVFLSLASADESFQGHVEIHLEGEAPTFRVNTRDLELSELLVDGRPVTYAERPESEAVEVPVPSPGRHTVRVAFRGRALASGLTGVYRSPYGPSRTILTSQMYPTGCRRLFPCVDVPTAKAVFRFRIELDAGAEVIFNTPPEHEERHDGRKTVRFAPTPKMSTYLVYLGVGPFELREQQADGVKVIVATPPGRSDAADVALEVGGRCVLAYQEYYRLPYPLPKLHLIAVPAFWAGAMENWGAIAFRETALLVDAKTDPFLRRYIVVTIAHEIAHQWFGNLVTMKWWDDFWLNESFATFVGYELIDRLYPDGNYWADFLIRETGRGLGRDALATTHPIQVPIRDPSEIAEIADDISYGKGASVLRMIEAYIGPEAFRRGVTDYLRRFQYSNAAGGDLWEALQGASQKPVASIMSHWVRTTGHPVLDLSWSDGTLTVRQERFTLGRSPDGTLWPVPLILVADGERRSMLLEERSATLPLASARGLLVNPGRTGFYHVRYRGALLEEMRRSLPTLPPIDQWGFLVDAYLFLVQGDLTPGQFRGLWLTTESIDSYLPARTAVGFGRDAFPVFGDRPAWREAAKRVLRAHIARVGLDPRPGEPETANVLRSLTSQFLVLWDDDFAREVGARFANFETAPGGLRAAIAEGRVKTGGAAGYAEVRARLPLARSDEEAELLACSLVRAPGAAELRQTLELLDSGELSSSRIWDVLRYATVFPPAYEGLWEWLARRLPELDRKWTGTALLGPLLADFIPFLGLKLETEIRAYFGAHAFPEAKRGIEEGFERLALLQRVRKAPDPP